MPYIHPSVRQPIERNVLRLVRSIDDAHTQGALNFALCSLFGEILHQDTSYSTIEHIVGATCSALNEFQRRKVGPYEDKAVTRNGDIYAFREKKI